MAPFLTGAERAKEKDRVLTVVASCPEHRKDDVEKTINFQMDNGKPFGMAVGCKGDGIDVLKTSRHRARVRVELEKSIERESPAPAGRPELLGILE